MEVLKISSKSNPNSVAGAIAGLVKESNTHNGAKMGKSISTR